MNRQQRRARVQGLVAAARRVDSPALRDRLVRVTGLSPQGVELALRDHLETNPGEEEVDALLRWAGDSAAVHVVLSANVFTAALRALCLAVATAPVVYLRCSSREDVFAPALVGACDEELRSGIVQVQAVGPAAGEEAHLYGSDETIAAIRASMPQGVVVRAHGTGMGIGVADEGREGDARALARDIVPFDQRGCLSPRVVFVRDHGRSFAQALAGELRLLGESVPRGTLDRDELADNARFRDIAAVAGEAFEAGPGAVALFHDTLWVAPVGRNMAVVQCSDPAALLSPIACHVAAIGLSGEGGWVRAACPGARVSAMGRMQKPALDGPVDLRGSR